MLWRLRPSRRLRSGGVDDVVGRRHEVVECAGDGSVVAQCAEPRDELHDPRLAQTGRAISGSERSSRRPERPRSRARRTGSNGRFGRRVSRETSALERGRRSSACPSRFSSGNWRRGGHGGLPELEAAVHSQRVISDLVADRVVEGVFAVKAKRRARTKGGAPYLVLELVDSSGQIDARVWNDVELLDRRFGEGDAVRVLGRVERFRDRLQLEVRTLEASDVDPRTLTPTARRDREELKGFLDFLAGEITHPGLAATVRAVLESHELGEFPATPDEHHSYAGGLLEHTVGVATLCRDAATLHPRLRSELLLSAALLHDVGRVLELSRGPAFTTTEEGRLLGHVHLGLRMIESSSVGLSGSQQAALLHCVAAHHDLRLARSAEAAVLYHANQLDALAATRPVE